MATFSKLPLSESTHGRGIKVTATGTTGTAIHTAVSGETDWDEIWLYCQNVDTVARTLTIEFGGTTDPDDHVEFIVAAGDGLKCIIPGLILQDGLDVTAFGDAANVLVIFGFVNRITA